MCTGDNMVNIDAFSFHEQGGREGEFWSFDEIRGIAKYSLSLPIVLYFFSFFPFFSIKYFKYNLQTKYIWQKDKVYINPVKNYKQQGLF